MISLVSATAGDWIGIYVDGRLEYEGHSAHPSNVLDAVRLSYEEFEVDFEALGIGRCEESDLDTLRANKYVYAPLKEVGNV